MCDEHVDAATLSENRRHVDARLVDRVIHRRHYLPVMFATK